MLKLAEQRAVMRITWRLSDFEKKLYLGECKVGIAYDVSRGLQLEIAHIYTSDVLRSRFKSDDRIVWVWNGVGQLWPIRSFMDLIRLWKELKQSADALKESPQTQMQICIPVGVTISSLQRFVSSWK